jgi:YgiT-type zinc finger domain-containing protein
MKNGQTIIDTEGDNRNMKRTYHPCRFCGGKVSEQKVTVDYRWGEDPITVIKNVPAAGRR